MNLTDLTTELQMQRLRLAVSKQGGPPGPPPRPGLEWNDQTHRWIRPDEGGGAQPSAGDQSVQPPSGPEADKRREILNRQFQHDKRFQGLDTEERALRASEAVEQRLYMEESGGIAPPWVGEDGVDLNAFAEYRQNIPFYGGGGSETESEPEIDSDEYEPYSDDPEQDFNMWLGDQDDEFEEFEEQENAIVAEELGVDSVDDLDIDPNAIRNDNWVKWEEQKRQEYNQMRGWA